MTSERLQALLDRIGCTKVGSYNMAPCPLCQEGEADPDRFKLCINPGSRYLATCFCLRCMIPKPQSEVEVKANRRTARAIWTALGADLNELYTPMGEDEILNIWEDVTISGRSAAPDFEPESGRAPDPALHAAYSSLLDSLSLSDRHRKWLAKRGFEPDLCFQIGYRSAVSGVTSPHTNGVPGLDRGRWLLRDGSLLIPARDRAGRICALKQRVTDGGRSRMRLVSSRGCKDRMLIHWPVGSQILQHSPLVVTEGERKADYGRHVLAYPSIVGLPGTGFWARAIELGVETGSVLLALDQDEAGRRCTGQWGRALKERGVQVGVLSWSEGKGLDDAGLLNQAITHHEWEEVAANYPAPVECRPTRPVGTVGNNSQLPPFQKGQKLHDRQVVDYVRFFQPINRSDVNAYQGTISDLIRKGVLRMEKSSTGQVLSVTEQAPDRLNP